MKESRLFKIMYYLLDKGSATAPELAKRFEVSVRTIYRDIDALSSTGIPVYAETGRNGGIHLLSSFILNKAAISEEEKQEILSALQGMEIVGDNYGKNTLEKLSALFKIKSVDWLETDFSRWGVKARDNDKFEMLKIAIIERRCMKIFYTGSNGKPDERIIEPLKLLYKSKDWYIKSYCRSKQGFRIFKLNRIINWELLEERFEPKEFPKMNDRYENRYGRVVLKFPKEISYRVYDEFDISQISTKKNGDLVVTAEMPEDDWLIGYILSFCGQVEIIEPVHLKKTVAAKAKEIFEKNKT